MTQIIYIPQQPTDDGSQAQIAAPAPVAAPQGGGPGLIGLFGAGLGGAALAKYGKMPKMFGRGAPAPTVAPQAPQAAPVPEVAPAPSPQPASPSEPPVDLTKALDPKVAPPPPKTGFAGGQPTDVGSGQPFGKRVGNPMSSGTLLEGPPPSSIPQITGPARSIPIAGPAQPAGLLPAPPKSGFGAVTGDDMAQIIAARAPPSNAPNAAAFSTAQAGARQTAQDAAQGAAMESEGGGSALSRFLGNVAGSAPVQVASKLAKGAGYAGMLANAVQQNAIIPEFKHLFMGGPDAGPQAVADAGPLTSSVEPATAHMMVQANDMPPFVRGAARVGGFVANSAARAADLTGFPAGLSAIGKYLGGGFGGQLDIPTSLGYIGKALGGSAQGAPVAPAQAATQPVTMQQNKDGTHTVTINGVAHHPSTHTAEDFARNAQASGLTLNDLGKMYALHQHFNPQQNAAAMALAQAEQQHNQRQMSDADFTKTLERWGLGQPALYPDGTQ